MSSIQLNEYLVSSGAYPPRYPRMRHSKELHLSRRRARRRRNRLRVGTLD